MSSVDPRERDDLCGRELVAERTWENLAEEYGSDTWYEAENGGQYCCREVWNEAGTDRCIWHADVTNKPAEAIAAARREGPERLDRAVLRGIMNLDVELFSGCRLCDADLRNGLLMGCDLNGVDLRDADLRWVNLTYANLSDAYLGDTDLGGADLTNANLRGVNMIGADLHDANLTDVDLSDTYLSEADFTGASLRGADLSGADLRRANLEACFLYLTTFEDTIIDESTNLDSVSGHELEADKAADAENWLANHISGGFRALGRLSTDPDPLENAETQYRTIQRLRREHDLQQDPTLEVQEKHARRKRALAEHRYFGWLYLAGQRHIIGYAEKSRPVVRTAVVVIGVTALLYPLFGLRVGKTGLDASTIGYPFDGVGLLTGLGKSVYFSVITFTTLGYGDIQPLGFGEAVATAESFVGALLMALLVYVLGRRATW